MFSNEIYPYGFRTNFIPIITFWTSTGINARVISSKKNSWTWFKIDQKLAIVKSPTKADSKLQTNIIAANHWEVAFTLFDIFEALSDTSEVLFDVLEALLVFWGLQVSFTNENPVIHSLQVSKEDEHWRQFWILQPITVSLNKVLYKLFVPTGPDVI